MNIRTFSALFLSFLAGFSSAQTSYNWKHTLPHDVQCIAFSPLSKGKVLFAASYDSTGIFRSSDGGLSWERIKQGFPVQFPANIKQIFCPPTDSSIVLAVSFTYGIFRSTDGGFTWSLPFENGGTNGESMDFHERTGALYYGQALSGPTWRSKDLGATWERIGEPSDSITLCSIGASPFSDTPTLLAGAINGAVARSGDEAFSWSMVIGPEQDSLTGFPPEVPKIVYSKHIPGHALVTRWLSRDSSLVTTFDDGLTWHVITVPNPRTWAIEPDQRTAKATDGTMRRMWIGMFNILMDTVAGGVLQETTNFGATWQSTGFPFVRQVWMIKMDTVSGTMAVATDEGVFITTVPMAVREEIAEEQLIILGNPVVGSCTVRIPSEVREGELVVTDMLGKVRYSRSILGEEAIEIASSEFPPAIYTILLRSAAKMYSAKLCILR